jgi:hypothetical protein
MDAAEMIRRVLASRQSWFELDDPPRRALLLQRPAELQLMAWRDNLSVMTMPEHVMNVVVGWRGFTEADLLGPAVGSSDEQPFSVELFKLWAADNLMEVTAAGKRVFEMVEQYSKRQESAAKN